MRGGLARPVALHQPVDPIERGGFVTFCQGRVVEDRIHEIVDVAAERKRGLADMDQLTGTFTENRDTEQLPRVAVKQKLQQSDLVADDLAARNFLVGGLADLLGDACLGQGFFALPHDGDLRDRVDAIGQKVGNALRFFAKGMTAGDSALFHRRRGETRKADYIANRVDMVELCLKVLIDGDEFAIADRQTDFI